MYESASFPSRPCSAHPKTPAGRKCLSLKEIFVDDPLFFTLDLLALLSFAPLSHPICLRSSVHHSASFMASRSSALPNTNWNLDSEATTDSLELKEQTLIVADDGTAQDHVPTLTQPPALSRPPSFDDDATRALTAPDGGKEAWLVLVGAFTLTFFYCGFNYSFGVFQAVFEKQDLASTPVLVILGSIPIAVLAIVAIRASYSPSSTLVQ